MIHILYSALGTLAVLALLGGGALLGWTARGRWDVRTHRSAEETAGEELQRLRAQQRAFEGMLGYNADIAYGGGDSL